MHRDLPQKSPIRFARLALRRLETSPLSVTSFDVAQHATSHETSFALMNAAQVSPRSFVRIFSCQDLLASHGERNQPRASDDDKLSDTSREISAGEHAARSPSPSRRHQHPPSSWMSPGKAAAMAATAAAQEAARAAAASVRAAEAAADAAEAAEAAAEAEEEILSRSPGGGGGGAFRSPPAVSAFREHLSPARSAFCLAEDDKEEAREHHTGKGSSPPPPNADKSASTRGIQEGGGGGDRGTFSRERVRHTGRGHDGGGSGERNDYRAIVASGRGSSSSSEEEKLRKARDQVKSVLLKPGRSPGRVFLYLLVRLNAYSFAVFGSDRSASTPPYRPRARPAPSGAGAKARS